MGSFLDRKAEFLRELVAYLGGGDPAALAERTGLLETTIRALSAGDGELMSWEIVSACLAAADVGVDGVREVRARWVATEQALWEERGDRLLAAYERNGNDKPAKIAEAFQTEVPWRRLTSRYPAVFEPWAETTFAADRRLPDPSTATDIRDFYQLLAELKVWAGSPRQSEIERRSWGTLPDATVSAMLQKDRWRAASDRERSRIGRFAVACGLPGTEVERWVEAYQRLRHVPPPDDLALARAEGTELRKRLAAAQAEAEELRRRLAEAETEERAPAENPQRTLEEIGERAPEKIGEPAPEEIGERRPDHDAKLVSSKRFSLERASSMRTSPPRASGRWDFRERRAVPAVIAVLIFVAGAVAGGVSTGGASSADRSICSSGRLRLIGSTAFARTADLLLRGYRASCPGARVEVDSTGSNEGVRALTADQAASTIVMHDGHLSPDSDEVRLWGLRGFPIALITFVVVVNKSTNVTGLSLRELRSIYAREGGPTTWNRIKGGASLPIRLVGRTDGSGTRVIFEERLLAEPEPELSSGDCLRKDELRAAIRTIRCERSSQAQVLDMVDRVPGAIGYAELHTAADARRHPGLRILTLDGKRADAPLGEGGYPFVAPEVFYTYGFPANDSPVSAFLTFLTGPAGRRLLQRAGLPECITPRAPLAALCQTG